MNNSWNKNRVNAGNNTQTQPRTSDFIGFSNDPPQSPRNRFNPTNCSSPQGPPHQNYGQNRQWVNKNKFNDYGNNQNNRSFNSSHNKSFNSSHNRSFNSSYNRSYNSNSGFNRSQNRSFNNSGHFKAKQDHNNTFNKQLFMHPSFMENPWAQLEAEHAQNKCYQQMNTASSNTTCEKVVGAGID